MSLARRAPSRPAREQARQSMRDRVEPPTVAIVLKGYPRLSETFIAQEIHALERRGLRLRIVSLRHPTESRVHPVHERIQAPVSYLPEYLHREPIRVWRAWRAMRHRATYRSVRDIWLRDLRRDRTRNRIRRFGQALVLAHELAPDVGHLHAHFLHTPGSVTRYAARLLGLPWSCSAHARDIWTTPVWEKREKLRDCRWVVTCTRHNLEHLSPLAPEPERVELLYHGLDLEEAPPAPDSRPARDGTDPRDPVIVLSVGRAVQKKGYEDLLVALAGLPAALSWRLVHVGDGPLLPRLRRRARRLGIQDRVEWRGALTRRQVFHQYRDADLFVLASRIARDGDRDGLPNVLMEAQSQRLACLATRLSAMPELIEEDATGVLVPASEPGALSAALRRLIADPALRRRLGEAGERRVRTVFDSRPGADRLAAKLARSLEHSPRGAAVSSGSDRRGQRPPAPAAGSTSAA